MEEEKEETLQAEEIPGQPSNVTPDLEARINTIRGGGQPLPESVRAFFEPRLGYDFSQVRVHTNSQAAETAQAVNAHAFTTGSNIVFGAGQYAPETTEGKWLLAHELTHVVQQGGIVQASNISIQRARDCDSPEVSLPFSFTFDITGEIYSRSFRINSTSLDLTSEASYATPGPFSPGDYCFQLYQCGWPWESKRGRRCFAIDGTSRSTSWSGLTSGDIYYFRIWKGMSDGLLINGSGTAT
ncbi:DUF4157 domain-containing protein [Candidatus Poribacteria bacterium]|nr:DUF4157 domain-containing protein [Candidatus Poribacteria bacterium]